MKRGGPLPRRTPLTARSNLSRTAWPARDSRITNHVVVRRQRSTGPPARVRALVKARSGGRCEWPDCAALARDVHHRLNRKDGGRHGAAAVRLNGAAWLLHACAAHHRLVTGPVGVDRDYAEAAGWVLRECDDARTVPVLTRHSPHLVLFDDDGDWTLAP